MKKFPWAVCLLLLCASIGICVQAEGQQSTKINTTIPDSHKVTLRAVGGSILAGSKEEQQPWIAVKRHTSQEYLLQADKGYELYKAYYNEKDITGELRNNRYTALPISSDAYMQAVYLGKQEELPDERTYTIEGYLLDVDRNPLAGIRMELHSTMQECITDQKGYYSFGNVESGEHSLLLYNGEALLGISHFVIEAASKDSLRDEVGENGKMIIFPSIKTNEIWMSFTIGKDFSVKADSVKDVTEPDTESTTEPTEPDTTQTEPVTDTTEPNTTQTETNKNSQNSTGTTDKADASANKSEGAKTGDDTPIAVYLWMAAGAAVVVILVGRRKKREEKIKL